MKKNEEPRSRAIRRKLKLTQEQFSRRYLIPLDVLQDWERRKAQPDKASDSYLTVISREPELVAKTLAERQKQ